VSTSASENLGFTNDTVRAAITIRDRLADGTPIDLTVEVTRPRSRDTPSEDAGCLQSEAAAHGIAAALPVVKRVLEDSTLSAPPISPASQKQTQPASQARQSTASTQQVPTPAEELKARDGTVLAIVIRDNDNRYIVNVKVNVTESTGSRRIS